MPDVVLHGPSFSPVIPKVTPEAIADAVNLGLDEKADAVQTQANIAATNALLGTAQQDIQSLKTQVTTANQTNATLQQQLTALAGRVTTLETATPPPATPNAVASFSLGATTNTTQVLNWTAPSSGVAVTFYDTRYKIAGSATWSNGPSVAVGILTATVTGLTSGQNYDYSVVTRNAAGPGVASGTLTKATTTSFTPSPAWTEITDNGGTITMNDGGLVNIVGGEIRLNGSPMGISNSVNLALINASGVVYQRNIWNNWWYWNTAVSPPWVATSDPRAAPPPSGTTAPPQAVAAGYTNQVLNNDFDNISEIANWTGGTGPVKNWYTGGEDSYAGLGNMSVSNSILSFNSGGTGFASVISTINSNTGPVTSAPGSPATNVGRGKLFRYGYFECKMRINSRPGPGWPAWWGTVLSSDPGDHLEIDFMESQATGNGNFNSGFLNWFNGNTPGRPFGQFMGALGATGYPDWNTVDSQSGISTSTPGDWNVFGFLWTPTYFEFYYNSWARRQAGTADYRHSRYNTTTPISGYISNDFGRPITMTLDDGANHSSGMYLILGSAGCDIDWVRGWQ